MELRYQQAIAAGVEHVILWSQLLDQINVFPIADGDTGRNLVISLSPMRRAGRNPQELCRDLLLAARGNSGNIAARFFHEFIQFDTFKNFSESIRRGRDQAWRAVTKPLPGTMLTFFDALVAFCRSAAPETDAAQVRQIIAGLEQAVNDTARIQPALKQAGVVDAGALGMLLFFDRFFNTLTDTRQAYSLAASPFHDKLHIKDTFRHEVSAGFCIDAVLQQQEGLENTLKNAGENVVVMRDGDYLKVHLHTPDREHAKKEIACMGHIISWSEDDLRAQTSAFIQPVNLPAVHIATDAAGSLTRDDARLLGITLLESYITVGDTSLPETCFTPDAIYQAMREGVCVSTAQASMDERYKQYERMLSLHSRVVYLCVGSVFTGNYDSAMAWKKENDPENGLVVIDTETASGRLAVLTWLTARYACQAETSEAVGSFARQFLKRCQEYIFIDKLQYLAAGGRLSRTGAFFGDMIHLKPVVSPQADGAQKVGVVRNQNDQIEFAMQKLGDVFAPNAQGLILLEYTDNQVWVEGRVAETVGKNFPQAEVLIKPLSLTTGVHTGPGTWAVAFAPSP